MRVCAPGARGGGTTGRALGRCLQHGVVFSSRAGGRVFSAISHRRCKKFTLYSFMQAVHVIRLKKEGDWPSPFTIGKPHRLAAERQQRLQSLTLDLGGPVLAAAASAAAVAASLRWPGPAPVPEGPTSTSLAEAQRLANVFSYRGGRACSAARRRAQPLDRRATRGCDRRPGPGHAGRAAPAGQPASPLAATTGALGARGRGAPRPPSASLRQRGSDY